MLHAIHHPALTLHLSTHRWLPFHTLHSGAASVYFEFLLSFFWEFVTREARIRDLTEHKGG